MVIDNFHTYNQRKELIKNITMETKEDNEVVIQYYYYFAEIGGCK